MIPDNVLSSRLIWSDFLFPDRLARRQFEDFEMGGIAIQNPSRGLNYQMWRGEYRGGEVRLLPANTGIPVVLFNDPRDITEFSFSFDQNMNWTTAVLDSTGVAEHKWYDPLTSSHATNIYTGIQSIHLCLDDKRPMQVEGGVTDVVMSYIKTNGQFCWRLQRERFENEYVRWSGVPGDYWIKKNGMGKKWRVQWLLERRSPFSL